VGVAFMFDEAKSQANREKHGIDFVDAQALWLDPHIVTLAARTDKEPRQMVVGMIAEKHWSAIVTYRGNMVRLISVRRSRPKEVEFYGCR
jgi:uncharacterized DUF497 family protein